MGVVSSEEKWGYGHPQSHADVGGSGFGGGVFVVVGCDNDYSRKVITAKGLPEVYVIFFHPWEFIPMPARVDVGEAVVEFIDILWENTGEIALREFERERHLRRRLGRRGNANGDGKYPR